MRQELEKLSYSHLSKQREMEFQDKKIRILQTELENLNNLYAKKSEEFKQKDQQIS